MQAGRIHRVLIVAPLSILSVWEAEFAQFAAFDYALAVLTGDSAKKMDTLRHMNGAALQVAVVNYESAWRMEQELAAWGPDLIVCDEGHKIKTHNISASKAMHRLGAKAGYRLLLTGTLITNKAIDVFSPYAASVGRRYFIARRIWYSPLYCDCGDMLSTCISCGVVLITRLYILLLCAQILRIMETACTQDVNMFHDGRMNTPAGFLNL